MKIVPFDQSHTSRCAEIFLTNQGRFFDPGELAMFRSYLANDKLTKDFYLIAKGVHRDFHGLGYGKALFEYRLARIVEDFGEVAVRVETSQHTRGFFEKFGFTTKATKPDGFGPGIDYVLMTRHNAFPALPPG